MYPGEPGTIYIRGPNVFSGYLDAIHNQGIVDQDGWLNTGDLGKVSSDGIIEITGRSKDTIIRSGHNIDPGAIEDALLTHNSVQSAAAIGELDAYAGEVPVAYVELKSGAKADPAELAKHIEPLISERPAFPKAIRIIDTMPLTAVSKVYKPDQRTDAGLFALKCLIHKIAPNTSVEVNHDKANQANVIFYDTDKAGSAALKEAITKMTLPFEVSISRADTSSQI